MSDFDKLAGKIENLERKQDDSTTRLEGAITKMSESIETFVAFQGRAEERHENSSKRLDKVEGKVEKLWDMVHKNSLIVNAALWFVGLIIGGGVTSIFFILRS